MLRALCLLSTFVLIPAIASAKTIVFSQPGFPTIASQPVDEATLRVALAGMDPVFADVSTLNASATLMGTDLLILPYGAAVPVDAWKSILTFLEAGGNLLIIGGQPLHVPVTAINGIYTPGRPQDSYSRALGLRHTYEVPVPRDAVFTWKAGYAFGVAPQLQGSRYFAVEGRLNGVGYMEDSTGLLVAAPVIAVEHHRGRTVALDFDPATGYWASPDGTALIRQAALYASQGATGFSLESLFALLRPGESPQLALHLHRSSVAAAEPGEAKVELLENGKVLESVMIPLAAGEILDLPVIFHHPLAPGFYQVTARYMQHRQLHEFYENGFWVSPLSALSVGPTLGVNSDTLTKDGSPFLPVGTNYFTTEENGWDFSGPRNAAIWEHDFAEMETHGVSFVRTGVWMSNARFIDGDLGGANERFLRNLEAYLLSAQRHHIAINFTFFAFSPRSGNQRQDTTTPPPNPYLNAEAVRSEQAYVRSVVERFKKVPWLCWDLINEPSFSNPRVVFKGNYPNADPDEIAAWHTWLRRQYKSVANLADAWSVTPEQLGSFDTVPLPAVADLTYERYGNAMQIRALDYNLFAQTSFSSWVKSLVATIRQTGSQQLINVGQDEGGVTDRVLNQFYGDANLSFTTNHTYWQDDALLWDSVVAKRPGQPNITGETGYQPAWAPDGAWRYDEFTGLGLTERKWALGFAAGSTGAMQWDWAREVDFGMKRSDGSAKVWENMMRDLGRFAQTSAPYVKGLINPQTALVLPQSLQMSTLHSYAQEATQAAVRTLYNQAHGQAYAVGEYQLDRLGTPKLILLPSPMGLSEEAWQILLQHVKDGAILLVTGPFDGDAHLHATGRQDQIGLPYTPEPLELRDPLMHWPGDEGHGARFTFSDQKTTVLMSAALADGTQWAEVPVGKGQVLFSTLPLELGDNQQALGRVYTYAMKKAAISSVFTTDQTDPGILICPTTYSNATLYVLTSETTQQTVAFHDVRSNKDFSGELAAGRAAILLIGVDGQVIASYHWSKN